MKVPKGGGGAFQSKKLNKLQYDFHGHHLNGWKNKKNLALASLALGADKRPQREVNMVRLRREVPRIQCNDNALLYSSVLNVQCLLFPLIRFKPHQKPSKKKSPWKKGQSSYCFQGYFNNNNHILEDFHHTSRWGMNKMAWFCSFGAFLMLVCEQLVHRQLRFPVLHQVAAVLPLLRLWVFFSCIKDYLVDQDPVDRYLI